MQQYDVIIVGGGIAGLSAARNLSLNGFDVLVLEAKDRLGGRIHSIHFAGATVDLGASWIHGIEENPITRLAMKHDVETKRSQMCGPSPNNIIKRDIFDTDFKRLNREQKLEIANLMADFLDFLSSTTKKTNMHLCSIESLKNDFIKKRVLKGNSIKQLEYIVDTLILYEYATEADDLSAESYHADHDFAGHDRLFPKGYAQIIYLLAEGVKVELNQKVQQIDYSGDMVQVMTKDRQYTSNYVLVTVPLGVLKRGDISFDPYLPVEKREALQVLKMGVLDKIYLAFDHVFWDENAQSIACLSEDHQIAREMINLYPLTQKPILVAFTAGEMAKEYEALTDEVLIEKIIEPLKNMYGKVPKPVDVYITRWSKDNTSYGSYSYLPVGVNVEQREVLADAIDNKVFFAGEATSRYFPSTVHGAFLSGVRASYDILQTDLLTEDIRKRTASLENIYL